jgi:asparagine synthetase B (glutamine-hydrolysing)
VRRGPGVIMLGCIALVSGSGARLALLQPMLDPLAARGGQAGLASGPELIAAVHQPGPAGGAGPATWGGTAVPASGPVSSADGRWVLCFSGRLDNLAELRAVLTAAGRPPAGPGEPAAVLAAFLLWGEGAVRRLRGDFAFALADQSCGSVYLARDPLGGRPLYWSRWADCLLIASQVKSLVPAGQPVREVPPGQHGWAEPGAGCDLVPFADPPGRGPGPGLPPLTDPALAADLVRDALRDAVAMRAPSGPLGVLVTGPGGSPDGSGPAAGHGPATGRGLAGGGLAGAIIARLACEIRPDCVVLTPGPPGSPDVALARRLAADLGLRHEAIDIKTGSRQRQRAAAHEAIQICEQAGEAGISAAMTMLPLLRQAHDLGVTAVLTGHGAPELFGASPLTWPPQPAHGGPGLEHIPHQTRGPHPPAAEPGRPQPPDPPAALPAPAVQGAGLARRAGGARHAGPGRIAGAAGWTGPGTAGSAGADRAAGQAAARLWGLVRGGLPGLDRVGTAAGAELRMPFLDLSVVCLGLRIPGGLRDGDGLPDWVLRQAFGRMLPGYVLAGYRHDGWDPRRRTAGRGRAPLSPRQAAQVYRSLGYDLLQPWPGPSPRPSRRRASPATHATPVTAPELHCAQARP